MLTRLLEDAQERLRKILKVAPAELVITLNGYLRLVLSIGANT